MRVQSAQVKAALPYEQLGEAVEAAVVLETKLVVLQGTSGLPPNLRAQIEDARRMAFRLGMTLGGLNNQQFLDDCLTNDDSKEQV